MSTTIIGFPRLGEFRELKFTTEKYFRKEISEEELLAVAKELRAKHWNIVKEKGITEIPSNDFSHYDNFLDAAFLFNVVPASVQNLELSDLERYFALARGYQGEKGDVRALPMKKWFNTNYHYIVPKFEKDTQVKLAGHKIFDEFQEAKELGLNTRPVLVGPFTFLQLSDFEEGVKAEDFVDSLVAAYQEVFAKLAELGATRIQLDEAALVKDLTAEEKVLFLNLYNKLLADKKGLEVLLQTYFGDVRDVYADLVKLPVDAIGLDFVEGKKTLELVKGGFPADKTLYAGIVSWEATFNEFKSFLTFNEVKTDGIYWQFHKVSINVTNVSEVSLKQDFKTFFVSQKLVVEVQEESFFFSCQIFNKGWLIELNTSSSKLCQFCKDFLVSCHKAVYKVFCFHTIFKVR